MAFQVELSHYQSGEEKELIVEGNDLDAALNLIQQEEPDFIVESICTAL